MNIAEKKAPNTNNYNPGLDSSTGEKGNLVNKINQNSLKGSKVNGVKRKLISIRSTQPRQRAQSHDLLQKKPFNPKWYYAGAGALILIGGIGLSIFFLMAASPLVLELVLIAAIAFIATGAVCMTMAYLENMLIDG